jgi:carbon storage regulator
MLYLMRKIGESIIINGDIEVKVMEVKGKSVKLGFEFPSTATVLRKEIHDRIIQENLAAAALGADGDIAAAMGNVKLPAEEKPKAPVSKPPKPPEK